ncbi:metallophosphoesterase family protein [Caldilinea sp.]|uniref:metallophosphoesterase family protein n=1 Tax=Caldilinea sp. TaxID=2293560 RepID=UPI0021DCFFC6|nr:metallophosphoesterase [Caldilinea sp.]GIV67633.1 MAG: serine/threonine protein phosphatase [Caldilinea sp.]
MRIVITADLHYRPAHRRRYLAFAERIAGQCPDCLILAGDLGHPLRLFRRALELFEPLSCLKLLVTGNHDLYCSEHDSRTLWESVLPAVIQDAGFLWLEEETVQLGDLGVCGTMGWYDYSTSEPTLALPDAAYPLLKTLVNHDADYIDWPWSDRAMARYLARSFERRLADLEANPSIRRILVVTHMPIFDEAIPSHPECERLSLLRAYMGNLALGEMVRSSAKVTHVVSGHLHRSGRYCIAGAYREIDHRVIGVCDGLPETVILSFD